ncbi:MAG: corrinoid protein [Chloroflexi bacterium]|nr:corrinoid protein [Chloroflexota bacterium]
MALEEIQAAVIEGNRKVIADLINAELGRGTDAQVILKEALIASMSEVGRRFECGECYVPEMLIAAKAMQVGVETLRPHLVSGSLESAGEVVIGTVQGDLHDIGKNLVKMMLEGVGFKVVDLGTDVSPAAFVAAVNPATRVVAMSALLTTTMQQMQVTIGALKRAGLRDQVKVLVGGAPLTLAYASQIGADCYAPDASSAARKAKELVGS